MPTPKINFMEEQFNTALSVWPTPRVPPTELENSLKASDHQSHPSAHLTSKDFDVNHISPVPPSPPLESMLLNWEKDSTQANQVQGKPFECGVGTSSNPFDTLIQDPNTSTPVHDEIEKDHSRLAQSPNIDVDLTNRIVQSIQRTMIHQDGAIRSNEVPLSEPVNEVINRSPLRESKKRSTAECSSLNDQVDGEILENSFIVGYNTIFLLKHHYDIFYIRAHSEIYIKLGNAARQCIVPHPYLPIGIYPGKETPAVIRVLNDSTNKPMDATQMLCPRYYVLIKWIYFLHEEWLKNFKIPTFMYRVLQERLLNWLDFEICGSDDQNFPIIGTKRLEKLEWNKDHQFRDTQIKLIFYFSQTDKSSTVFDTAAYLLEAFKAENSLPMDGLDSCSLWRKDHLMVDSPASNDQMKEFTEFYPCNNFKKNMEILLSLSENQFIFNNLVHAHKFVIGYEKFSSLFLKDFSDQFKSRRVNLKNKYRSVHPRLSMGMYFESINSDNKFFHILRKDRLKRPLKSIFIYRKFNKLLKAINHIHLKAWKYFNIEEEDYDQSIQKIFEWLIKVILKPQGYPPLFGAFKLKGDLAPWEDARNGVCEGFQMVQLQLIVYFSQVKEDPLILKRSAGFVLTTWYLDHYSTVFHNLVKLIEHKFQFQH
ncbi:hypothetical protein PGTUg99_032319 [Puccinia graminis f. sp. tritici]|uniref:Uncharacterized protein n=1 Tax=Puccinia graminis f. sp. tritici TaxID=56615 RepID=A0A5B0SM01_PUCGR|nr:hypothetical protein PGTUg99_032319 [Puccinia graminis f. sp. tritici]